MKTKRLEEKDKYHLFYLAEKINNLQNQLNVFQQEKVRLERSISELSDGSQDKMLIDVELDMVYIGSLEEIEQARQDIVHERNNRVGDNTSK